MEAIRGVGLHIALDSMYGVSLTSLKTILYTARCDLELINDEHDTLFGGRLPASGDQTQVEIMRGEFDRRRKYKSRINDIPRHIMKYLNNRGNTCEDISREETAFCCFPAGSYFRNFVCEADN